MPYDQKILPRCLALACIALSDQGNADEPDLPMTMEDYIEQRCTFCHSGTLSVSFMERIIHEDGYSALESFLASHHLLDEEARAVVLRHLRSREAR